MPRPFNGRIAGAARFTQAAGDWLIAEWSRRLNERHGRSHPTAFWGLCLRAWLATLLDLSFDKYYRLRALIDKPFLVHIWPRSEGLLLSDTRDILLGSEQEPLNRFVMSRIAESVGAATWIFRETPPLKVPPKVAAIRRKERLLAARRWSAPATTAGRVLFYNVPGLGAIDAAVLSLRSLSRCRVAPVRERGGLADPAVARRLAEFEFVRQGFGDAAEASRLLELFDSLSQELLPENVGKGYPAAEREARWIAALTPPWVDTIVCGPALGGDDPAKLYFAWMRAYRGCRIVVNQHGGNYGLLETYSFVEQTDYRASDCFLSWGWREQTGCDVRAIPAPSPMLDRLRHLPVPDGKIILVTTNVPTYNARIDSALFAEDRSAYREAQVRFAQALDAGARQSFWLRQYGRTGASERTFWNTRNPGTRTIDGPLHPELEHCRLAVIDHPGTTMCLTMAAGIPTVLFWDPGVWQTGAAAQPALTQLRGAGILHDTPESAAEHVNRVADGVDAWWNSERVRSARAGFSHLYCRRNRGWRAEWRALFADAASPIYTERSMEAGAHGS